MQHLDLTVLLWLHDRPSALIGLMRVLTLTGSYGSIFLPIGIGLAIFARDTWRTLGLRLLLGLGIVLVVVDLILKPLVARPRPYILLGRGFLLGPLPHGLSFPSGHTAAVFVGATIWALGSTRYRAIVFPYAVAVGWSRLYLGAHWPTDVLAGAAIGFLSGYLASWIASSHRVEVLSHGRTTRRNARRRKLYPEAGNDEP